MHSDGQIRQIYIRLEANRIQNERIKRSGYENRNRKHEMGSYEQRLIIGLILDYK